jgi:hypothetical protein
MESGTPSAGNPSESSHIRPRIRSTRSNYSHATSIKATDKAISSQINVALQRHVPESKTATNLNSDKYSTATSQASIPKSILKAPKFSGKQAFVGVTHYEESPQSCRIPIPGPPIVQEVVVERPRHKSSLVESSSVTGTNATKNFVARTTPVTAVEQIHPFSKFPTAVEGFVPRSETLPSDVEQQLRRKLSETHIGQVDDKAERLCLGGEVTGTENVTLEQHTEEEGYGEPLVFSSLADLMEAAGTLPDPHDQSPPSVIEADLSFACMDPETYQEEKQQELQQHYEIFLGYGPIEDLNLQSDQDKENSEDDEASDGGLWDILGDNEEGMDETTSIPAVEPRIFLDFWNMLSQWITPQAVEYVRFLQQQSRSDETFRAQADPRDDVSASRCAGLMAVLQMHVPRMLQELGQSPALLRLMHQRLADLLRTWDFCRPSPKLDTAKSRALTCILLETVLVRDDLTQVPDSCEAIGLSLAEYKYLSKSAIVNFGTPDAP